jgi:hypothetical protein
MPVPLSTAMNASNSLSSSAALFGDAMDARSRPAPAPLPRPLPRIGPNFLLWLQRDVRVQKKRGEGRTNSHHGRLSFGLRLTEPVQKWWLLDPAEQRRSRCAGTSRRPIIKIDGNGLTFERDFKIGSKGDDAVFTPFAKTPSNCFFARVASAGVSNVMIATPDERPLRSY